MVVSLVFMVSPVQATETDFGYKVGDYELTLQGSGASDKKFNNTAVSVEVGLGYFLTPMAEIGVRQGIGYISTDDADNLWNGSTRMFMDLNFDLGKVKPFIGANLGYLYGDGVNETWIAGPEAGVKAFVSENAFVYLMTEYNFTFDSTNEADDAFDDGRFAYALGLGINW